MKIIYKFSVLLALLILWSTNARSQCSASFISTVSPGGGITFSSTSTSANPAIFTWAFGDGQTAVGSPFQYHIYQSNGVYTVTLTLNDSIGPCTSTTTQTVAVSNAGCVLNAGFTTYMGSGGKVLFTNTTSGVLWPSSTYTLDYGDGSTTNFIMPLIPHTYAAGTYTTSFTVANNPTCTSTYSTVITVSILPCPLNPSFTYTVNNGTVNFLNTSTGATSTTINYWDFGNGNTASTYSTLSLSQTQTYPGNGQYTVSLTMQDSLLAFCSSTSTQTITLTSAPCLVNSSFNLVKDTSVTSSVVWNAYPAYPANVTAVAWNWGDGSTSTTMYPSHTFSATGYYNICLSVTVACGSSTSTCMNSSIYRVNENMQIATVHVIQTAPTGIATIDPMAATLLFPNPASNELNITNTPSEYNVVIVDMLGNTVYIKTHNGPAKIDLQAFKSGVYFIQLSGNGFHKNSKLIKE